MNVKRSPFATTVCGVVSVLALMLGGCSLFQRTPTGGTTQVPTGATGSLPASPRAVKTAVPIPTPTAPSNAPVPPVVPGYVLTAASPVVLRKFQTVAGQFRGVYSGLTVRTVLRNNQAGATVVLLGLHPELVGNTQVEQRLVPGMIKGMSGQGAKVTTQKINGMDVAVATTKTTSIVAWYRAGTVVLVLANGADAAPSVTFSRAYLAAK
ncbi:MAG TPA: hypothetical protein VHN80_04785 [Kineosporiaceae bacterium]|nr:hypothetical protein [Kineosporiaceae bacterium]